MYHGTEVQNSFKEVPRGDQYGKLTMRHQGFRKYVSPNQTCPVFWEKSPGGPQKKLGDKISFHIEIGRNNLHIKSEKSKNPILWTGADTIITWATNPPHLYNLTTFKHDGVLASRYLNILQNPIRWCLMSKHELTKGPELIWRNTVKLGNSGPINIWYTHCTDVLPQILYKIMQLQYLLGFVTFLQVETRRQLMSTSQSQNKTKCSRIVSHNQMFNFVFHLSLKKASFWGASQ